MDFWIKAALTSTH